MQRRHMKSQWIINILLLSFALVMTDKSWASVLKTDTDPLNKPQVWEKLLQNPGDSSLWSAYVGKPWVCMTIHEKEDIDQWKANILSNITTIVADAEQNSMNISEADEATFWDSAPTQEEITAKEVVEQQKELQAHFSQMEKVMMQEPVMFEQLKRNIGENFVILDDMYMQEFVAMGVNYKSYFEAHPDGKYSQEQWIEEKTAELQKAKAKQFSIMRAEMLSSTTTTK